MVARGAGVAGEVALRRRGDVLELIVAGVFAMDSAHTATERALALLALRHLGLPEKPHAPAEVRAVVGGLGLGYTLDALLTAPAVTAVHVVELEPLLPRWAADGFLGDAGTLLNDPRVRVEVGDIRKVVTALPPNGTDLVLLDVDNGPDFLVHPGNAQLYRGPFLATAARALRPGGVLAVWSADPAPALAGRLRVALGECTVADLPVRREGRDLVYSVFLARKTPRS
jgi:spermidine synthase